MDLDLTLVARLRRYLPYLGIYAADVREAANEIERQYRYARIVESYLDRETLKEVLTKWRASADGRAHSAGASADGT